MTTPLVIGNWKMNGSLSAITSLLDNLNNQLPQVNSVDLAICPPFPYIPVANNVIESDTLMLGAQNLSEFTEGAYTGEVSGAMLQDMGVTYVLVGHSERRSLYDESNNDVADKFAAAIANKLTPVLCLGESLKERNESRVEEVIGEQLNAVLDTVGVEGLAKGVIAYEPVWAIGTGLTASAEQAQAVHAFIRQEIAKENNEIAQGLRILYGGSVKPENASDIFKQPDVNGGLIGGASLKADDFVRICIAAQ